MTLQEMAARLASANTELQALRALGDGLTEEQFTAGEGLVSEISGLRGKIERFSNRTGWDATVAETSTFISTPVNPLTQTYSGGGASTALVTADLSNGTPGTLARTTGRAPVMPTQFSRQRLKNFKDADGLSACERAYQFGQWFRATAGGVSDARKYCGEHGIPLMWQDRQNNVVQLAHVENVNASGGFLVPPQFESDLIDLREQFGVARRILRNRAMSSDTLSIPRRTGGLTAYWVTDNVAITESTKSWDLVTLVAKKLGVLAKSSSELNEDAIINVMDDLAGEIAYAFTAMEDDCAFNGDGTSTYGGMQGFRSKLQDFDGAGTDSFGLVAGTGNLWSELVLSDFNSVKAKLPRYAQNSRTRWVVSQQFYSAVMERLMLAAGGITDAMIATGAPPRFLGAPVEITQKMPTAEADTTVCALYGDFSLAAEFGDRRQTTIAMSEHYSFANDVVDIRGTQRFDIVVHDIGNASVAGPVVGLRTIT